MNASIARFSAFAASCAAAIVIGPSALSMTATFTPLGDLPGGTTESEAWGVSDDGSTVVGISYTDWLPVTFRWRADEGMVPLAVPKGMAFGYATGISGDGSVITGMAMTSLGLKAYYAAVYWNAELEPVSLAQHMTYGMMSYTAAAAADGSVLVGTDMAGWDIDPMFSSGRAFVYQPGIGPLFLPHLFGTVSFADLSAATAISANGSVVVGFEDDLTGIRATRWVKTGSTYVPRALGEIEPAYVHSQANAVTPDGTVIVGTGWTSHGFEPFRWTQQTGTVSLSHPPGSGVDNGTASAVSADGSIVVGSWAGGFKPYYAQGGTAFIWDARHGVRDLKTVIQVDYGLDLTGWHLTYPSDMSPDGRSIVGIGFNPQGKKEGWLIRLSAPIPADLNGDGHVNGLDLALLLGAWGRCPVCIVGPCPCAADLDHNSTVNGLDLAIMLGQWG